MFEWDALKNERNRHKHGVDFDTAKLIFDGVLVQFQDTHENYGEIRMGAYGEVNGVVLFVIYTQRQGNIRLISARGASTLEKEAYYAKIQHRLASIDNPE